MRYIVIIILGAFLISAPVHAAPAKKKGGSGGASNQFKANWKTEKEKKSKKAVDTKKVAQAVDIPMLVIPLTNRGYLSNYAYVAVRINLNDGYDAWAVRGKSHFLKDAIIRKTHTKKLALVETNYENGYGVDTDALKLLVQSAVEPWVSQDAINTIEFMKIDLQN